MTVRRIATGKRGDFGALPSINHDRSARAGGIVEAGEAVGAVAIAPGGDSVVIDIEGGSDGGKGLAAVEFEQGGRAFEGLDGQRAFGAQALEGLAVGIGEGDMRLLHPGSVPVTWQQCKRTSLTDY